MRIAKILVLVACISVLANTAWAAYGVRISDLRNSPLPPNPIRVWGKVTSEIPLMLSDQKAEIQVNGISGKIGDTLVVNGDWDGSVLAVGGSISAFISLAQVEMICIPAGSFLMGNNGAESGSNPGELPQHSVFLSGYYIGKYEVTRGEYCKFMESGGYSNQSYWSTKGWSWKVSNNRAEPDDWAAEQTWGTGQTFTQTDNHPVVGVTYYEAEAFCNWAGGHLPAEAQWEKAARWTGSYPNVYPWGNTWDAEKCNNKVDNNPAGGGYNRYQTAPVGSYPSGDSPYGCKDMSGNVAEWCKDWYKTDYYSQSPAIDPQGPSSGTDRVMRGSNYSGRGREFCCAYRSYLPVPDYRYSNIGFRLIRDIETVAPPKAPAGKRLLVLNASGTYTTTASTCNFGHTVEYSFNWGDGTTSPWSASTAASHTWNTPGTKSVTVTARCQVNKSLSATSAELSINVVNPSEMVNIPAGSFVMGNNGGEPYSNSDELPSHSVYLPDYSIGKYEVKRCEYKFFMDAGGYSNPACWSTVGWSWKVSNNRTLPAYWAASQDWGTGAFTQTDNYPVVGVSYYEAEAFCNWAGGHLPTEAQWEKAARWTGNFPNVYPWGNAWDAQRCNNWYDSLYPISQTVPVGSYPSGVSPYGCQDMAGNVWEWCQDWYKSYPGSTDPFDYTGSYRILRGGGWYDTGYGGRCAYRDYGSHYDSWGSGGFRLAR